MFLQLGTGPDGAGVDRFRGEAKDAEYRNQIEINDWKWNLIPPSDSSSMAGTGANASQSVNAAEPSILSFSKTMCRASSAMLKAMMTGEFLHAVISLEEDSDVDFLLTLTLTEVRICGYELDISGPEVKEKWDLDYKDIKFLYRRNYADVNGDLLLTLTRSANASKDKPGSNESKILSLAESMSAEELKPLAKKLEEMSMKASSVLTKGARPSQNRDIG
jgi:type VI protein secretion system component Hcp